LVVRPQFIVCLAATAAQSVISNDFLISKQRGELLPSSKESLLIATHHPSAILRAPADQDRTHKRQELVRDLKLAAKQLAN
jgi:DNA polymerase